MYVGFPREGNICMHASLIQATYTFVNLQKNEKTTVQYKQGVLVWKTSIP
jgi:hypothetical protein